MIQQLLEDGPSYLDYSSVWRWLGGGPRVAGAGGSSLGFVKRPAHLAPES